jgi:hypothetical protein
MANIEFSIEVFLWEMFILLSIGLWIYVYRHMKMYQFKKSKKRLWVLIVICLPTIGSILYLLLNKKHRIENP